MKILKTIVWISAFLINFLIVIRENPGVVLADNLFFFIGRILGLLVISFILLLPLVLLRKRNLVEKILPFTYLVLSLLSLTAAIINYSSPITPQTELSTNLNSDNLLIDLPPNWKTQEPSGENMIFSATNGESLITIHKRTNAENVSFSGLTSVEKETYTNLMFNFAQEQFEDVELVESSFIKVSNYDVFYLVYKRTIDGHKTINMVYQLFEKDLYTLTAITPEDKFVVNQTQLDSTLRTFRPRN